LSDAQQRSGIDKKATRQAYKRYSSPVTLTDLRAMPDDELIRGFDATITSGWSMEPDDYLNELARRAADAQGDRIETMTRVITHLTWIIAGLTLVGAVATVVSVILVARS
jgi:hypothetical protein